MQPTETGHPSGFCVLPGMQKTGRARSPSGQSNLLLA